MSALTHRHPSGATPASSSGPGGRPCSWSPSCPPHGESAASAPEGRWCWGLARSSPCPPGPPSVNSTSPVQTAPLHSGPASGWKEETRAEEQRTAEELNCLDRKELHWPAGGRFWPGLGWRGSGWLPAPQPSCGQRSSGRPAVRCRPDYSTAGRISSAPWFQLQLCLWSETETEK